MAKISEQWHALNFITNLEQIMSLENGPHCQRVKRRHLSHWIIIYCWKMEIVYKWIFASEFHLNLVVVVVYRKSIYRFADLQFLYR